jgi:PDZ domain-containing protein
MLLPLRALVVPVVVLGALLAWAGTRDTSYFVFSPQPATEVAPHVTAKGEAPDPRAGGPGFLFVAIGVQRASLLERWTVGLDDGADLVEEREVIPPGHDDEDVDREGRLAMADSQKTAAAVAERALGKPVRIVQRLRIAALVGESPARRAGLRRGDVIVAVAGRPVRTYEQLAQAMRTVRPGARVAFGYRRGTATRTVSIVTRADPHQSRRAVIGVQIAPPDVTLPVPVSYRTGDVGGPSAGLAFALEIYSALSRRKIVQGHRVAVTGSLDLDGRVHPIGGIKQKAFGAADAEADVFLVPEQNAVEARRWAPSGLRIVAVESFDEALAALRALPRS